MKKLVCGCLGTIYYATILKNGLMGANRVDVTDDALNAVTEHLLAETEYKDKGYAGYSWDKKDGNGKISLVAYDTTKYKLCPINETSEK